MYTPNLVSILFYDQPLSIFKFDDVMPTSRIVRLISPGSLGNDDVVKFLFTTISPENQNFTFMIHLPRSEGSIISITENSLFSFSNYFPSPPISCEQSLSNLSHYQLSKFMLFN